MCSGTDNTTQINVLFSKIIFLKIAALIVLYLLLLLVVVVEEEVVVVVVTARIAPA